MRTGPNNRRPMRRGGGGNSGNGGNSGRRGGSPRTQNFESNGPDVKVRGNAQQIVDKYQALAREAATAGDPVMAENYYQHAEHYYRVLTASGGGDTRHHSRHADSDDNRGRYGGENGQGQSTGQAAESSGPAEPARQPETAERPANAAPAQVVAASEATSGEEAADGESKRDRGQKSERRRGPRSAKPAKTPEEPVSAASGETAPAASMAQPAAGGTETIVE